MHQVLRSAIKTAGARVRRHAGTASPAFAMLRLFAHELHASLARAVVYAAVVGAMALGIAELVTVSRGPVVAQAATAPDWIEVGKPFPAFAMTMPEFDAARYSIWRHASGSGRKDILTFGETGGATAVVEIHRPGFNDGEPEDVTASIPELRLSGGPSAPKTLATKFGPMLIEAFTDQAPGGARRCLRFARNFDEPRLEIGGRFCNAGMEIVDHGMVACALDRLTLQAAGSEPKLATLFARAEVQRNFCGQKSVFLAATPKRPDWIEAARDPKLRR